MNIAFYTLGCKVNQYETEVMREGFCKKGYTVVSDESHFDCIVINSCTVTAESDRKTRQAVRHYRREQPESIIVLTGCMVQAFSEEAKTLTEADIVVGNTDVLKIIDCVESFRKNGEKIFEVSNHEKSEHFNTPPINKFAERTRAYMKIEDGCERFCTYCIIPTARGYVRSKPFEDIRKEAEILAEKGFSEIVLVGINLSAYGTGDDFNLCDAVDACCDVDGIKRVRLGSLEPDHISDEMLNRFASQSKFCPQFHLSLQSGCDSTLKRMNRHYDTEFYSDLVFRIRKIFKNSAITTDIMVGFPGETEEEFKESLNFANKISFAKAHIFAYSRRNGTVAAALQNQISSKTKSERSKMMSRVTMKTESEFLMSHVGSCVEVLFESNGNGFAQGYTKDYTRVHVKTDQDNVGKIRNVFIKDCDKEFCIGEFA